MHALTVILSSTFRRSRKSLEFSNLALAITVTAGFAVLISGCAMLRSSSGPSGAVKIDSIRKGPPSNRQTVPVAVRFDEFRKAGSKPEMNGIRFVQIAVSPNAVGAGEEPNPEYRLFDIQKGSVGDLLGLENADVLVAANGYIVFRPDQFMKYLAGLPFQEGTFIEIRRDGKPMLLQYEFTGQDSLGKTGAPADEAAKAAEVPGTPGSVVSAPAEKQMLPVLNNSEDDEAEMESASAPVPADSVKTAPAATPSATPAVDKAPRKKVTQAPAPAPKKKKTAKTRKK